MPDLARGLALLAVLATGCGPEPSGDAVVRAWAAEISRGDTAAATRRFDPPAELWSASGRIRLVTRMAVRFFNDTLPCGARVLRTRDLGSVVLADVRLTDRPGGDCGADAGRTASIVLEVRDGLITRWMQLPGPGR